jgi:hypothetical protein
MTAIVPEHDVFYSRVNRGLAAVIWIVVALVAVSLFLVPPGTHLWYLVPLACIALLAWEMLWVPAIDVSDQGILLTNPFRSISIPWAALVHADTKYALTLYTPGRTFAVWAAPAPGRAAALRADKSDSSVGRSGVPLIAGSARPGDLLSTESGQAAHLVRTRWARLRAEDRIPVGQAEEASAVVSWHFVRCAAVLVLVVGSVAAVLFA